LNGAMSSSAPGPRPRQVTIGGWLSAVASTVLVVSVFDAMAQLHSLDTRDRLSKALTGWPRDLGISIDDAIGLTRGALFVTGVAAVVTAILGVFVLQRHATARIVLTVAAVPLVLTAPVAGGFLGLLVGGATAMLWTREARDWFAGRTPQRPVERPPAAAAPANRPSTAPPWSPPSSSPPPPPSGPPAATPGWGQAPEARAAWPPPAPLTTPSQRATTAAVPSEVRIACALTWVFSVLTAGAYVAVVIAVAVDRDRIVDLARDNAALQDSSMTDSQLVGLLVAVSAVVVAWCMVAAVLAALTWRGQPVAWAMLVASAAGAALLSVVALPYSVAHLVASAIAVVLLMRRATRTWIRRERVRPVVPPQQDWPPPSPSDQRVGASDRPEERPSGKPPVW
jgi:hypothetical protein